MATIDERLGAVEGAQQAHEAMMDAIHGTLAGLREDMNRRFEEGRQDTNRRFEAVDRRFDELRQDMIRGFEAVDRRFEEARQDTNRRFEAVDERFGEMRQDSNRRFDAVDRRFDRIDHRLDVLEAKGSRQFTWLVGMQVMTLAAVVTSMAAILAAITSR